MKDTIFTKELKERIHGEILKAFEEKGKITEHYFVSGYFIFEMGESSVMHFKIDSAPQWKFGVWLNFLEGESEYNTEKRDYIEYEIFAQNELWIDKFKPSASEFTYKSRIYDFDLDKISENLSPIMVWNFRLIFSEPKLAFYRHMTYSSFDEVYTSCWKATVFYYKFLFGEWKDKVRNKRNLRKQRRFTKRFFRKKKLYYEVIDIGENWSPRYEVEVVLPAGSTQEQVEEIHNQYFKASRAFEKTIKNLYRGDRISSFLRVYEEDTEE